MTMSTAPVLVVTGAGSGIGHAIAIASAAWHPRDAVRETVDLVAAGNPGWPHSPASRPTGPSPPGYVEDTRSFGDA